MEGNILSRQATDMDYNKECWKVLTEMHYFLLRFQFLHNFCRIHLLTPYNFFIVRISNKLVNLYSSIKKPYG